MREALETHPNIDFSYTYTNIPTHDRLPAGYRYADEVEAEYWWHIKGAVQVMAPGCPAGEFWTDIAVPKDGEKNDSA